MMALTETTSAAADSTAPGRANSRSSPRVERWFFVAMAATIAIVVFAGFAPSFYLRGAFEPDTRLPNVLQVHGAVFSSWIALFLVQTILIARGSRTIHRRLGWLAAVIALAMVGLVAAATVEEMRRTPPMPPPAVALALNTFDMVVFALLVSAAIFLRKQRDWHKRFLLSATLVLLGAPILRLLMLAAGHVSQELLIADVLLVDLFFLVCFAADLYLYRKIHPAFLCAFALLLVDQVTTFSVMAWPPWIGFANALQRFVS